MVIALLILIVFILLFGAGVVKGWLANAATLITGFVVLIALVLWVGSFFGQDGPIYVFFGGAGLLLLLAGWMKATEPVQPAQDPAPKREAIKPVVRFHSRAPSREERKKLRGQ